MLSVSRKKIVIVIFTILFFTATAIGGRILYQLLRQYEVSFAYGSSTGISSVLVFKGETLDSTEEIANDGEPVVTISESGESAHLTGGKYYYIAQGDNIRKQRTGFTVESSSDHASINVVYSYTEDHLSDLSKNATSEISLYMSNKYGELFTSDYSIVYCKLYGTGVWAGILLARNDSYINDTKDYYRAILHKDSTSGEWSIINEPRLYIEKSDYKDVPSEVISNINSQTFFTRAFKP